MGLENEGVAILAPVVEAAKRKGLGITAVPASS